MMGSGTWTGRSHHWAVELLPPYVPPLPHAVQAFSKGLYCSYCDIHLLQSGVLHCLHCGYLFQHGSLQIPGGTNYFTVGISAVVSRAPLALFLPCPGMFLALFLLCQALFCPGLNLCPFRSTSSTEGLCGLCWGLGLAGPVCVRNWAALTSPHTGPAARTQIYWYNIQSCLIKGTSFNWYLVCTYLSIYDDVNLW